MEEKKLAIEPAASRLLNEISRLLAKKHIPAYIVGGFIRDTLLGHTTADIDIAVDADALAVAVAIADALEGKSVPLDDVNLIGRVILPDSKWQIDFSTLQGDIQQDLARRDFTIDAMALELGADFNIKNIIDPFHGQDDLRRRSIKAVSDDVFKQDAVRLLRAVRLAAELDFTIQSATEKLIVKNSSLIGGEAGERPKASQLAPPARRPAAAPPAQERHSPGTHARRQSWQRRR